VGTETAAEATFRGDGLNAQKRYIEALSAYEQALALDPQVAAAWLLKGHVLEAMKQYEEVRSLVSLLAVPIVLSRRWVFLGCPCLFMVPSVRAQTFTWKAEPNVLAVPPGIARAGHVRVLSRSCVPEIGPAPPAK
jgi:hypothetical protein